MAQQRLVEYLNPDTLIKNPFYTQAVAVTAPVKMLYIGAQTALNKEGVIVGQGDIGAQTEQVLKAIEACLEAGGAKPEHLIHWTIYLVQGHSIQPAIEVGLRWWGNRPNPPANTGVVVADLVPHGVLVAIDAVAAIPLPG